MRPGSRPGPRFSPARRLLLPLALRPIGLRPSVRRRILSITITLALVLIVLVDVRLLRPPATGLEDEDPSEDNATDEVGGRELERRLAQALGELGEARRHGGVGEGKGELVLAVPSQYRNAVCDLSLVCMTRKEEDRPIRIEWDELVHGLDWAKIRIVENGVEGGEEEDRKEGE